MGKTGRRELGDHVIFFRKFQVQVYFNVSLYMIFLANAVQLAARYS